MLSHLSPRLGPVGRHTLPGLAGDLVAEILSQLTGLPGQGGLFSGELYLGIKELPRLSPVYLSTRP